VAYIAYSSEKQAGAFAKKPDTLLPNFYWSRLTPFFFYYVEVKGANPQKDPYSDFFIIIDCMNFGLLGVRTFTLEERKRGVFNMTYHVKKKN
jgi:hypothetical protein